MEKHTKRNVVEALEELSDEALQRRRWLSSGEGEVSSFTEAVCQLFDDSGLGHELDRGRMVFSPEIDDFLRRFGTSLHSVSQIDQTISYEALIAHPDMAAIRAFAKTILILMPTEEPPTSI